MRFLLLFGFLLYVDIHIKDIDKFEEIVDLIHEKEDSEVLEKSNNLIYMQEKLTRAENLLNEEWKDYYKKICEMDEEISRMDDEISKMDDEISRMNDEIFKRDKILDNIKELVANPSDESVLVNELKKILSKRNSN